MSQKLNELLNNRLSHSFIETVAIECEGKVYTIGSSSIDSQLAKQIKDISGRTMSVLLETSSQQIFSRRSGNFIIIIAAKKIAPLSFLRSACQNILQIVVEDSWMKERIASEGATIIEDDDLGNMLKSFNIPKGEVILRSTIPFISIKDLMSMTDGIDGYIWISSREGKSLILLNDGGVVRSVFEGERTWTGEEAMDIIFTLKEGVIEFYKYEKLPDRDIQDGLHLLGLDDDFVDAINEAKRLRQQLSNTINGGV
ncbi:MAG: hypothetical protein SVK08_04560 [Halobacteriota archaeon]|nr:hypothetical protein [Halobacteriota archaeon]